VETVGVGQSEVAVANMVDCFLFLTLARTGDSLQGIKKGILELSDVIAVNKADGEHQVEARKAARELSGALRMIYGPDARWTPPVLTCSGLSGEGLDTVWQQIGRYSETMQADGSLQEKRRQQQVDWAWSMVREQLLGRLAEHPSVREVVPETERAVRSGELTATLAAERILRAFTGDGTPL
jgi:LAO/AO transport system kinase